jgi:hypothetical protein
MVNPISLYPSKKGLSPRQWCNSVAVSLRAKRSNLFFYLSHPLLPPSFKGEGEEKERWAKQAIQKATTVALSGKMFSFKKSWFLDLLDNL